MLPRALTTHELAHQWRTRSTDAPLPADIQELLHSLELSSRRPNATASNLPEQVRTSLQLFWEGEQRELDSPRIWLLD